ncbi:hypothetical protein [Streptomyces sp. NPDC088246]|uniref:hypothetical protein n=1 Tax=Streptomyces sp. NPDC088246 TaxID=3365842 RepID=UPI00382C36F2
MTFVASTPGSVEATTALLQAELPRLEEHQQALGKELVTVTERLESVRTALSALQALSATPPVSTTAAAGSAPSKAPIPSSRTESEFVTEPKGAPREQDPTVAGAAPQAVQKPSPARKAATAKPSKAKAEKKAVTVTPKDAGNLTEQVMKIVAASGSTPVRARDVTQALGRELSTGSINSVRSTLDRLVATSRAHRAGPGLYQAPLG